MILSTLLYSASRGEGRDFEKLGFYSESDLFRLIDTDLGRW